MSQSGRLRVLAPLFAVAGLTACTTQSAVEDSPARSHEASAPTAATDPSGVSTATTTLRCEEPEASLVTMAKTALATHPGPVRAAKVVRAAMTGTGTWYVIGIDRAYVLDDGTSAGGASRSLGLTNAPAGNTIIPLGERRTPKSFAPSWDRVSWTGDRLIAGKRAARTAIACLDAVADESQ